MSVRVGARIKRAIKASPLAGPAFKAREWLWAIGRRVPEIGDDGLPLPPPLLMVRVVGEVDPARFQSWGSTCARLIKETAERHGMAAPGSVLDFGCGCGRVTRYWRGTANLCGTDVDRRAVRWAARNLPFARFTPCDALPPLDFATGAFDLLYALSVLTHLSERSGMAWLRELHRVARADGLLYVTMHGDKHASAQLGPRELAAFRAGEYVTCEVNVEGSNLCAAYVNQQRFSAALADAGWRVLEMRSEEPRMMGGQDAYVARRVDLAPGASR